MKKGILFIIVCLVPLLTARSQTINELYSKVRNLKSLHLPDEIALYYQILAIDSTEYEAVLGMGKAYYSRFRILGEVDQLYLDSALIQMTKACSMKNHDFRAFAARGNVFYNFDSLELAYTDFTSALKLKADVPFIRFHRIVIDMGKGHYEQAINDLTYLIQNEKDNKDDLYRVRAKCFAQLNKYKECHQDILKAFKINKKAYENYLALGDFYALTNNYEKALQAYEHVRPKANLYAILFMKIGNVYHKMGKGELAQAHWKKAEEYGFQINENTTRIQFDTYKNTLLNRKQER